MKKDIFMTKAPDKFTVGYDNLSFYSEHPRKVNNGVLLFCNEGEGDITIDLNHYHVCKDTSIILIPGSIFFVQKASDDFRLHYFSCSIDMFQNACFRLPIAFIHFLKENSCYTHTSIDTYNAIAGLTAASTAIYQDRQNCFRETIALNLLQIFFLDTYDKVQRLFTPEQIEGSDRKDKLFKKFMHLIHTYCSTQHDVAFYAQQLCISTRYLSTITRQIGGQAAKTIIDRHLILELKVALQSTELSLKEIADRYGFPEQSFFGRYFKKHTGMSPKEFRGQKE